MGNPTPDNKMPVFVTLGLVVVGVILALVLGSGKGLLIGGVIAGLGFFTSLWGMWIGMQQETQGTLGLSILALLASLAATGIMVVWGIVKLVA